MPTGVATISGIERSYANYLKLQTKNNSNEIQ